jgi:hypothetical protein
MTPETEVQLHQKHMQMNYDRLAKVFPTFKFRGYLIGYRRDSCLATLKGGHKLQNHEIKEDTFLA